MRANNKIEGSGFTNKICRFKFGHEAREEGGVITHIFNVNRLYLYIFIAFMDMDGDCRCFHVDIVTIRENGEPSWTYE